MQRQRLGRKREWWEGEELEVVGGGRVSSQSESEGGVV